MQGFWTIQNQLSRFLYGLNQIENITALQRGLFTPQAPSSPWSASKIQKADDGRFP
jgi:hypothetical protein